MKKYRKYLPYIYVVGIIFFIYLFFPVVAGMLKLYDCRGPKFYFADYHYVLYRIGYTLIYHGKPREPIRRRTWFYGIRGELYKKPVNEETIQNIENKQE